MKPAFIQYRNLNTENNYEIYSDNGNAFDLRGAPVTNISPAQLKFGTTVNVDDDVKKIYVIPKVYDFIISGNSNPQLSGLKFYKTTGVFNSNPVYFDQTDLYALWKVSTINTWFITTKDRIGTFTTGPSFGFYQPNGSIKPITGSYTGVNWSGSFSILNIDNKLRVYNTPGFSGFAGDYTTGVFTVGLRLAGGGPFSMVSKTGFRNNQNSRFYILKDDSPNRWVGLEWPLGALPASTTWYSVINSDAYPPVTGWQLGDNSAPFSVIVGSNALPTPEMNFGTCPGNTLIYPDYIYKAYSQDPDINKIYFYSGGTLSSSGTSNLFPNNENLSDMFPDLYNTYFDKQFFYSDLQKNNRYFLFKTYTKSMYEIVDLWYIVKSPSSYNNSGYYYWVSQDDYITGDRNNYFNSARKIYKPHGTQINNLKDITIDIQEDSLNKESPYKKDFNLQNFSGELLIKTTGNNYVNDFYKLQKINSGRFNGLTGISGQFFIFANPNFNLSGVTCGNQAFTLNPSASVFNGSGRLQFVRATEGFQFEVQFTRNLQSGWNPTGITLVPSSSQSNVPSGFIREEFYLPLSQLGGGNLFFRMRGVPAVWKILNSDYSFTNFKNCQPSANILPYNYFSTGVVSGDPFLNLNYEIVPVYKHNELIDNRKMLKLDSQYNYSQVSGIFNLNTGQSFVFQFFNEQRLTGIIFEKSGNNILGRLNSYSNFNSTFEGQINSENVTRIIVNNESKNSIYYIFRSGASSSISKLAYDKCYIFCGIA